MMLKSLDKAPGLAGLGLFCVVGVVAALPFLRDPQVVAAIEQADASASSSAVAPETEAPKRASTAASADPSVSASASATPAAPSLLPGDVAPNEELDRASTVDALRALAEKYPKDPRLLTKLAKALSAGKNGLHDAVVMSRRIFELNPKATTDPELQMIVKRGASGQPATSDLALDIMASSMGSTGPDLLFEISLARGVSTNVRTRATDLTRTEAVRKLVTPALRVALDLRDMGGCERQKLFADAEKLGDGRSLQYLTPLQSKKGCGLFRLSDCYGCLGNRVALGKAVSAIQARAKQQAVHR
jgi:hypothetical protein